MSTWFLVALIGMVSLLAYGHFEKRA